MGFCVAGIQVDCGTKRALGAGPIPIGKLADLSLREMTVAELRVERECFVSEGSRLHVVAEKRLNERQSRVCGRVRRVFGYRSGQVHDGVPEVAAEVRGVTSLSAFDVQLECLGIHGTR